MSDDFPDYKTPVKAPAEPDAPTMGMSSVYRLFEAFIGLRERNERQHRLFEQTLNRTRDSLESRFNSFAAETQKAYQQLRQEVVGEKKFSLALLNELLDLALELDHILTARPAVPPGPEAELWRRWLEALEIQDRKIQETLVRFGIHPYDAVIGAPMIRSCTSASAAGASTAWTRCALPSSASAATPASSRSSCCVGPR